MLIIRGEQTTFQQLSGMGATITYSLSIFGLLAVLLKNKKSIVLPILGLVNCGILLSASVYTMWWSGNAKPILIFSTIVVMGMTMYCMTKHSEQNKK